MGKKCKCKICGTEIEVNTAFKREDVKTNWYCCSEDEYIEYDKDKKARTHVIDYSHQILGGETPSTILYKEMDIWHQHATWKELDDYLMKNVDYITSVIQSKDFNSEVNKIRYMSAIVKNNINDFKANNAKQTQPEVVKPAATFIPVSYTTKSKRRGLANIDV